MKWRLALALFGAAALLQTARAEGDAAAGKMVFNKCLPCHSVGAGATNKVGPELNGLDGRHSGTASGYNYSAANKNSGIVWNKETFAKYIQDPRKVIPGTKMFFPGIKNQKEIDDLWAYLSAFKADGSKK